MVHKLHKYWANSVQANYDQRQSSWPSSSLSLKEVAVYLYCGFCDQASSWSSSCEWTEELCSHHSSQLVLLKLRIEICATVSHVLGSRASKRETVTTEQV